MPTDDFRLMESMRILPDGKVFLFTRHLERLSESARHFSFHCDLDNVERAIQARASQYQAPAWLRLTLGRDGHYELESGDLAARGPNPRLLKAASVRVNSGNPFLYYKTTKREIYDAARREGNANTEALLANERGEITEITIGNVAVRRKGQWITPQQSCGLLAGVMRSELLDKKEIAEGIIRLDELISGETVRCFNALRGVFDVTWM